MTRKVKEQKGDVNGRNWLRTHFFFFFFQEKGKVAWGCGWEDLLGLTVPVGVETTYLGAGNILSKPGLLTAYGYCLF